MPQIEQVPAQVEERARGLINVLVRTVPVRKLSKVIKMIAEEAGTGVDESVSGVLAELEKGPPKIL